MTLLPKHIAIIMDGNGRWAERQGLERIEGHQAGAASAKAIITACAEKEIEALTLFAFGLENQKRPLEEIEFLMSLFLETLRRDIAEVHKNNIQMRICGDRSYLSPDLKNQIEDAEKLTEKNTGLKLSVAINYSGRWDILQATQQIVRAVEGHKLSAEDITAELYQRYLCFSDLPEPDLLIRTSGESRISNFMLWQFAYTEFYFTEICWPDFKEKEFELALAWFQARERRFGLTTHQLKKAKECLNTAF